MEEFSRQEISFDQNYDIPLKELIPSAFCEVSLDAQKRLQPVQNVAVCLVFNQPKRAHITPLLMEHH